MSTIQYSSPESLADALQIKSNNGVEARVIAGATDLILRMRDRVVTPGILIDLRRASLDHISSRKDALRIGSFVTLSQILASDEIQSLFPALSEACRQFAGPPIRNRATLGGNIVNASPAADLVPPLMAYDARIVLTSVSGDRVLRLNKFFTGPGQTVIQPDEILTEIRLPQSPPDSAASFIKLGARRSMAISVVNLCTRLSLSPDGSVGSVRIVLGAVAPKPMHATRAEELMNGRIISPELILKAAREASEEVSPISDVRASASYRKRMTEVLVRRALMASWDGIIAEKPDG